MRMFMYPQMRNFKAIETIDLSHLLTDFQMKQSALIDTAILNTAEAFFASNPVEDVGLIEYRKRSNNYDVDAMMLVNKDKNNATFGTNSWTIHCVNYLCAILDRKLGGVRLRDLLLSNIGVRVQSLYGKDAKNLQINTVCGQQWVLNFVSKIDELSSKIRVKGNLIRAEDIKMMTDCLDLLTNEDNFKNVDYYDEASVVLVILAKAISDYRQFMKSNTVSAHSFINRKRTTINKTLSPASKECIIKLLVAEQQFKMLKALCGEEFKLEDVFQFNKRSGALELKDTALEKFIKVYSRDMLSVLINTASFELKLEKKWDSYKGYLETLLLGEVRYHSASTFKYKNLWCLFFDENFEYNGAMDDVSIKRQLDVQSEIMLPALGMISEAVDKLYRPCDGSIVSGFSLSHHLTNGRDLIYRLEHNAVSSDEISLLSGILVERKGSKGKREVYSFKHNLYNLDKLSAERVTLLNSYPGELSQIGSEGIDSSYGVAVCTSHTQAEYLGWQKYRARSFNFIYGTDDPVISISVESNLVTILPPSDGQDIQSFGTSTRRSSGTSRYETRTITDNSDIIDVLLAVPAFTISSLDQETLAGIYKSSIENLVKEDAVEKDVLYVGPSSLEQMRPVFGTFLNGLGDENLPYRKISYNCLPENVSSQQLGEKQLPRYVTIEKDINVIFEVPFEWLTSRIQEFLVRFGHYSDIVGRDGKNILTLYFKDHSDFAKHCIKEPLLNPDPNSKFEVVVQVKGDIRDIYKMDRFIKSMKEKDVYLFEIKYLDPELSAAGRKSLCILDGEGKAMSFEDVFKIYPSVEGTTVDIAFSYALDLAYSIWFYKYSGVAREDVDISVLLNELESFGNWLEKRYNGELKLARICKTASGDVRALVSEIKVLSTLISETSIKKIISSLSITSSFELYSANVLAPIVPSKRYSGVMDGIFQNDMKFLSCVDKPTQAVVFMPECFNERAVSVLNMMLNSYTVRKKGSSPTQMFFLSSEKISVDEINKKLKGCKITQLQNSSKYLVEGDVEANKVVLSKLVSNCSYSSTLAKALGSESTYFLCRYKTSEGLEDFVKGIDGCKIINEAIGLLLVPVSKKDDVLKDGLVEIVQ